MESRAVLQPASEGIVHDERREGSASSKWGIIDTAQDSTSSSSASPNGSPSSTTMPQLQVLVNGLSTTTQDGESIDENDTNPKNCNITSTTTTTNGKAAIPHLKVNGEGGGKGEGTKGLEPGIPQSPLPPLSPALRAGFESLSQQGTQFLATATPEVLGAVILGTTVVMYWIFGKVVLFVAGVLVGILVHSSWETQKVKNAGMGEVDGLGNTDGGVKRMEVGDGVIDRPLIASFSSLPSATAAALENLTTAIVNGYVSYWYSPLLPGEERFPNDCKEVLTRTLVNVHTHISQKRPTDTLILFLTSTSNILIVFFRELSTALGGAGASSSPGAAVGTFVEDNPSSALAQLIDQDIQRRKLHSAAEDLVQTFVERKVVQCAPVRTFLQEILAGMVLKLVVEKCSEADFINEWIIYMLKEEGKSEPVTRNGTPRISIDNGDLTQQDGAEQEKMNKMTASQELREADQKEKERKKEARISRAEEAMQQAMREAEELTRMIEEEERKKLSGELEREVPVIERPSSPPTTDTISSPTFASEARDISTPLRARASSNAQPPSASPRPGNLQRSFTSFDQIVQPTPTAPRDCLHKAHVTLADLSPVGNGDAILRSKPISTLYMLQIEPHSSYSIPGWILTRKYTEFESLHETIIRLSIISGAEAFAIYHSDIPTWKGATAEQLRHNLEVYINAALHEAALAQCDAIKRFLDKDGAMLEESATANGGNALSNLTKGWTKPKAFKNIGNIGDNVLDALTKAPQEAAIGGKALFGGMFNNVGNMRKGPGIINKGSNGAGGEERKPLPMGLYNPPNTSGESGRVDVVEAGWVPREEPPVARSRVVVKEEETYEGNTQDEYFDSNGDFDDWVPRARSRPDNRKSIGVGPEMGHRRGRPSQDSIIPPRSSSSGWRTHSRQNSAFSHEFNPRATHPAPMDFPDDFLDTKPVKEIRPPMPPRPSTIASIPNVVAEREIIEKPSVVDGMEKTQQNDSMPTSSSQFLKELENRKDKSAAREGFSTPPQAASKPTTEQETQLIVEMLFAILSELFTLSSAWLLRRSLLNVAKNILLRPGNTSLEATRLLIQETLIEGNTSDKAIAQHITKLRQNIFPTDVEMEEWRLKQARIAQEQEGKTDAVSEVRRKVARRLLLDKGMPEALKGVMGQAACRESLGRVFDSLQVKSVARGVVCGLVLEVVRGVCQ